ncbi:unnamed protein product [Darwinula stevensoni]|uniref:Uncharacterized protein n=1 Tax=Darwinula stevensoni TaxID=69355 RepID=A0A7R9AA09_9CRUS|nr:unnamed protein product [Darwinula stevensoni]CAG0897951.1 unnamed protein product [Darwinula stevensoni]
MAMTYWRQAGLNYIQFSAIAAKIVRRALKAPLRAEALRREEINVKINPWKDGKPVKSSPDCSSLKVEPVHGHLGDPMIMNEGSGYHQHMEDLMTLELEEKRSFFEAIETFSLETHEEERPERGLRDRFEPAFRGKIVHRRDDSAQTEAHEHSCTDKTFKKLSFRTRRRLACCSMLTGSQPTVLGLAEFVPQRDYHGRNPQRNHGGPVLGEQFPDKLRVAVYGVKGEAETKAEDGSEEECSKDQLLLHLHLDRRPGQVVSGHCDERHAPWIEETETVDFLSILPMPIGLSGIKNQPIRIEKTVKIYRQNTHLRAPSSNHLPPYVSALASIDTWLTHSATWLLLQKNLTQQMSPDIPRLRVDPEDGPEAGGEGRQRRPMPVVQEVIVLEPGRKVVERHHLPRLLAHLPHEVLRGLHRVVRHEPRGLHRLVRHQAQVHLVARVSHVRLHKNSNAHS